MLWQGVLLGLLSAACWSCANVAIKGVSQRLGSWSAMVWAQLIGGGIVTIIALVTLGLPSGLDAATWGWIGVAGLSGAVAYAISAEKPESRGYNFDAGWGDEFAFWRHAELIWSNIKLAMRKKNRRRPPRMVMTCSPRPTQLVCELVMHDTSIVTHASAKENASKRSWPASARATKPSPRSSFRIRQGC